MGRTLGAICLAGVCAALACARSPEDDPRELGAAGGKGDSLGGAAPLRFVAVGDTGKGNDTQQQVADAIRDHCAAEGCDFAVLLGDNLYPEGAEDVEYMSGHDHQRQWLDPSLCAGTELVVNGAGGEVKELDDPDRNPAFYQDGVNAGFLYAVVDGGTFTGRFVDASGAVVFERSVGK